MLICARETRVIGSSSTKPLQIMLRDSHVNRGNAKRAKGDWEGALTDYNRVIELKPDLATAYNLAETTVRVQMVKGTKRNK
jgi:hypothetical protein